VATIVNASNKKRENREIRGRMALLALSTDFKNIEPSTDPAVDRRDENLLRVKECNRLKQTYLQNIALPTESFWSDRLRSERMKRREVFSRRVGRPPG
jgi:hypothetical protein